MDKIAILNKLELLIRDEIELYRSLSDLYDTKRQVLIANDTEGLLSVDDKIIVRIEEVKSSVSSRKAMAKAIGNSEMGLSEMIKIAETVDEEIAEKLRQAQIQINALIEKIGAQERVVRELLRHGLNMVSKTLQVVSNTAVVSGEYTRTGKSTASPLSQLSSVVTEV